MTPRSRRLFPGSICLPLACALLSATGSLADPLDIPIERRTLDNGLRVVMAPDRAVPTVGVAILYDVGSFVESPGRTGFAHLFEHMMFEGTEHVGKAEHFEIVAQAGGYCNGSTGEDKTQYYEALPSNALELALWLEADRMTTLDLTEPNFENQRQTVIRERQDNIDNQAFYPSFLRINELAYGDYFPYAHPVIGEMEDIEAMPFAAAREFFRTYYAPNNAVLAIAGDFEVGAAMVLVERQFGRIPRSETPAASLPPMAPRQGERRDTIEDPLAPLPGFHVAYHVPPRPAPESWALDLLATWLADGETSPLYLELVKERALAQQISVGVDGRRGPDLFSVWVVVAAGRDADEIRDAIDARFDEVAASGMTAEALERAKNRTRANFLSSIQSNLSLALQLGSYEMLRGDATLLRTELDRYDAVTSDDVRRAAATYLRRENRVVLDVVPANGRPD